MIDCKLYWYNFHRSIVHIPPSLSLPPVFSSYTSLPFLHRSREEGDAALQALREALGRYDLPFAVLLSDPDMAAFRAMPQFRQLQEEVREG